MADTDNSSNDSNTKKLIRLGELKNYSIPENEPDVRAWAVYDSEGTKLGTIKDMLVDTDSMKVRYFVVSLIEDSHAQSAPEVNTDPLDVINPLHADRKDPAGGDIYREMENILPGTFDKQGIAGSEEPHIHESEPYTQDVSRHILIPVGIASLDREHRNVIVSELSKARLIDIPTYDGTSDISPDYDNTLRRTIGLDTMTTADPDRNIENKDRHDPDEFHGTRLPRPDRKDDSTNWDTSPRSRDTE